MWPSLPTIALIVALIRATGTLIAQSPANPDAGKGQVTITELSLPAYPALARQIRISGDVQLELKIQPDGSLDSLEVFSGHPLLAQAALDSAKQSHFRCNDCNRDSPPTGWCTHFILLMLNTAVAPPRPICQNRVNRRIALLCSHDPRAFAIQRQPSQRFVQ
jgi:TonB family protein